MHTILQPPPRTNTLRVFCQAKTLHLPPRPIGTGQAREDFTKLEFNLPKSNSTSAASYYPRKSLLEERSNKTVVPVLFVRGVGTKVYQS
ncbi:hypothetical protein SAMN06265219_102197 [Gracilimonas mengyeensis]|uniref:Uncharacterized protein n=1 Tax=Gracilimonas mengyeensis TaxID=1302730 RepID=A0A521BCZ6_9BACT|nr:hypothetical protein SAMN06265219_102197 [Gracilimonas mengyeensis]